MLWGYFCSSLLHGNADPTHVKNTWAWVKNTFKFYMWVGHILHISLYTLINHNQLVSIVTQACSQHSVKPRQENLKFKTSLGNLVTIFSKKLLGLQFICRVFAWYVWDPFKISSYLNTVTCNITSPSTKDHMGPWFLQDYNGAEKLLWSRDVTKKMS